MNRTIIILLALFTSIHLYSQSWNEYRKIIVKGTVVDRQDGEPLIGTTIIIRGTSIGSVADIDGNYQIKVKEGDVLSFSFIGYTKKEILYAGVNKIDVTLEEENLFIGDPIYLPSYTLYGRKLHLSSSVSAVNRKLYKNNLQAESNTIESTNGLLTGIYIAPSMSMFAVTESARSGIGNIGGKVKYVVDDVVDAPFNFADISVVTALKNPADQANISSLSTSGAVLNLSKDEPYSTKLQVSAWNGIQNAIGLLPHNKKSDYKESLQSAYVQHYDVKFKEYIHSWRNSSLMMDGAVIYDHLEGTIKGAKGQRFTPRLTLNYKLFNKFKFTQTGYYDLQKEDNKWLYTNVSSGNVVESKQLNANKRNELFSASTLSYDVLRWLNVKSTFTYDWIDTKGDRANDNEYYNSYRDYFDFRNQDNSKANRWLWDNTISIIDPFDRWSNHYFMSSLNYRRDIASVKTYEQNLPPLFNRNIWDRDVSTTNVLLTVSDAFRDRMRTISASVRRLSSSLIDDEKGAVYLPTVSASWNIYEEEFVRDCYTIYDAFSKIRFKGGWGKTAETSLNIPISAGYKYGYPNFSISDLKWQETSTADAGIELEFFRNWGVSAGYYHKTTNHLLKSEILPSSGNPTLSSGNAKAINRGWDLSAKYNRWFHSYKKLELVATLNVNHSSIKGGDEKGLLLGSYIAPKYNYGLLANGELNKFMLKAHFHGVADLYLQARAFDNSPEYVKANYFGLKNLSVSYLHNFRFVSRNSKVNLFASTENLFMFTNSALKDNQNTNYVYSPINRMFAIGFNLMF